VSAIVLVKRKMWLSVSKISHQWDLWFIVTAMWGNVNSIAVSCISYIANWALVLYSLHSQPFLSFPFVVVVETSSRTFFVETALLCRLYCDSFAVTNISCVWAQTFVWIRMCVTCRRALYFSSNLMPCLFLFQFASGSLDGPIKY
jgi:fucose 4-O-acetylase-like acetyltransferase